MSIQTMMEDFGPVISKMFIGSDLLSNEITDAYYNKSNYPPFNIIHKDENHHIIEMALAGFTKEDISISTENGILTVKSSDSYNSTKKELTEGSHYHYRGISARQFMQKFKLYDDAIVTSATLKNGFLTINLERVIPERLKTHDITIND
jgi:molecular chaperone IbpA